MDTTRLTLLLDRLNGDETGAFSRVVEAVYDDFRAIAHNALESSTPGRGRPGGASLGITVLANDALMELKAQRAAFANRDQFFALATRFMFRIIAHHRRDAGAQRRAGNANAAALDAALAVPGKAASDVVPDDATKFLSALSHLHEEHPEAAEIVTLHSSAGLPLTRVAELTGLPLRTVERRWQLARAYLADLVSA